MRTGIRERYDGMRMLNHLQRMAIILVRERLQEELFHLFCQRQIDNHFDRMLILFRRNLSNRAVRRGCTIHYEEPIALPDFGQARMRIVRFVAEKPR